MPDPSIEAEAAERIALVRHGRSAHVHGGGWIDHAGLIEWRRAYEASGIAKEEAAPAALSELAAAAGLLLASDAPRAVESAKILAGPREVRISPLLRELTLDGPRLFRLRLPLAAWAVAIGLRTLVVSIFALHPSAAERERAREAAELLADAARTHGAIVAVTHASFRRRLAGALERHGWVQESRSGSWQHWSVWTYTRRKS